MSVIPSTTTPTTSSNIPGSINNQSQFNTEYTQFLQMLTTEMQNQDPTSPMDTNQFTQQLVSFSQLEQQLQTNQNLTTMINNQTSSSAGTALGYLGHTVMATGDAFQYSGSGDVSLNYTLPSAASTATLTVTNSSGATVGTYTIPSSDLNSGLNTLSFDGTLDNGTDLSSGDYTYSISATDVNGNAVTATTYTSGVVTGLDTISGTPTLHLGNLTVPASSVVEVTT